MRRSLRGARFYSLFLVTLTMVTWAVAQAETLFHFDLPAQSLAETLRAIGAATNTDIGFALNQVAGLVAPPLKADLTVDAALARVLSGTGFRSKHLNDHTIVIATMGSAASESARSKATSQNIPDPRLQPSDASQTKRNTQSSPPLLLASTDSSQLEPAQPAKDEDENTKKLQDVVVTGSHLRGVADTGSSVQVITREDIERAGFGTVTELIQTLPQAFGGDVSENTLASIHGGSGDNLAAGTGVDLRGLGANSTLVLVNGRRLAPSNAQTEGYTDVSSIPLAAIDRVEIVADGASAIYGSDAVAGVVNFILRRDFEGADTRLRYGTVTQGNSREIEASQTFGHVWSSGSGVFSYEYYDRSPLSAADRYYTDTADLPFTLLPQQRRNSFFGTISNELISGLEVFADGNYSQRSAYQVISSPTFIDQIPSDSSIYNLTLGARADLPGDYQLNVGTSYASSAVHDKYIVSGANTPLTSAHTKVISLDPVLNGSLFILPAGPIAIALGGQFRKETLNTVDAYDYAPFSNDRTVTAGFTEFSIPLVGPKNNVTGVSQLTFTLADRYEHYSDFGSTNNPKIGLVYWPNSFVKLRGSYGNSYRAPDLIDLNPVPTVAGAILNLDPLTGQNVPVMALFGGNPNLRPETAHTWSLGLDLSPDFIKGLRGSATYYNIKYANRISSASDAGYNVFNGLSLENTLGPEIVQRNPSVATVSAISGYPNFVNLTGIPGTLNLQSIAAILYFNSQNLSEVQTSGIDFNLDYNTHLSKIDLETGVDGTYVLKFDNQFESTTPVSSVLNTPFNPINLKLRAKWILSRYGIKAGIFLNYVNAYTDNRSIVPVKVASWTTADLSISYRFPSEAPFFRGTSLELNIRNITNASPPYVASADPTDYGGINFDGTNANPLGRFLGLQIEKKW